MSSLNINQSDKDEFVKHQPEDMSQAQFFHTVWQTYKTAEVEPIDVEALADELKATLVPATEVGAYRAVKDYHESNE